MLTLLEIPKGTKKGGNFKALFKCDCGQKVFKNYKNVMYLKKGLGCNSCKKKPWGLTIDKGTGPSYHPIYKIWSGMHQRCSNPKSTAFKNYGGRGIAVCEQWDTFQNFLYDMGGRPSLKHSLDRINVNGNYEPKNCRWSTPKEQVNNKRKGSGIGYPRYITEKGVTMNLADWGKELGLTREAIRIRIKRHGNIFYK